MIIILKAQCVVILIFYDLTSLYQYAHTGSIITSSGIGIKLIIGLSVVGGMIAILILIFNLIVIGIKFCGHASSKAMDTGGIAVHIIGVCSKVFFFPQIHKQVVTLHMRL